MPRWVVIGDGALGIWGAVDEIFPGARRQRCWNHRAISVIDKLPKRMQGKVRKQLRELAEAPTRAECERLRDELCAHWRIIGQVPAAECLVRDWDDFVTFYDFPQEHWLHLRTTNPIESIFAGVRLRTNAAKRMQKRENALYLIFKLVCRLSLNWRAISMHPTNSSCCLPVIVSAMASWLSMRPRHQGQRRWRFRPDQRDLVRHVRNRGHRMAYKAHNEVTATCMTLPPEAGPHLTELEPADLSDIILVRLSVRGNPGSENDRRPTSSTQSRRTRLPQLLEWAPHWASYPSIWSGT